MKTPFERRPQRGGFTLMEVMLVLMILVIIASMAVMALAPMRKKALKKAAETQIQVFEQRLQAYEMDIGEFPSTSQGLDALLAPPSDLANQDKWFGPYLKARGNKIPKDPWGNEYVYEYPGKNQDQDWPDLWCLGPDRQDGTDDDVGNWMVQE
ncbi:MAG: type II secretion system major pseudopilin GspG [Planctomycetes bacterium]|nr:type II secretion system major pseudopilin GspG [Planctomycetota bacterium]